MLAEAERHRAEARKFDVEAHSILAGARAAGAKEITPIPGEGGETYDEAAEDEAIALLREIERRPGANAPQGG